MKHDNDDRDARLGTPGQMREEAYGVDRGGEIAGRSGYFDHNLERPRPSKESTERFRQMMDECRKSLETNTSP
tara:strand:+ start:360 stop:578 length:219 start_codon:yes stop_codon:yes gene_type:complete